MEPSIKVTHYAISLNAEREVQRRFMQSGQLCCVFDLLTWEDKSWNAGNF